MQELKHIKTGPRLPKLSQKDCLGVFLLLGCFLTHGVVRVVRNVSQ